MLNQTSYSDFHVKIRTNHYFQEKINELNHHYQEKFKEIADKGQL